MGSLAIARLSVIETIRRREFYVVLILLVGLAVWIQTMDIAVTGSGRFAKGMVMQITWLASFGLAVPLAARQILSDLEQKTVYVLISRPIHRWHYVFGKMLGAAAASVLCFAGFFVVLALMLMFKGVGSLADSSLWQAFALQIVALVLLCSITVFFSTFSSSAGAVTFALLLFVLMHYGASSILGKIESANYPGIAGNMLWAGYLAMPHFEFFDISQRVIHGWGPLPMGVLLLVLAYGITYSLAVTGAAAWIFRRRWL